MSVKNLSRKQEGIGCFYETGQAVLLPYWKVLV